MHINTISKNEIEKQNWWLKQNNNRKNRETLLQFTMFYEEGMPFIKKISQFYP